MSDRRRVTCGAHGETPATFTCQHVAGGIACGFHASGDDPEDAWPDAWCDACDERVRSAGGEWTEAAEHLAEVGLLCTQCYDAARARNRHVPELARGVAVQLTDAEAVSLVRHAVDDAQARQAASNQRHGWLDLEHWAFDDDARTLTFSGAGRATLVADVQLIGSYSTKTGSFQWAWETLEPRAPMAEVASQLRMFGQVRGLTRLTTPNWPAEEVDGWEMASLASYLYGGEGTYRAPFGHQYWFMMLTGFRSPPPSPR